MRVQGHKRSGWLEARFSPECLEAGCTLKACVTLMHRPAQGDLHHMHQQRVEPEISIFYIFSRRLTQKGAGPMHGANVCSIAVMSHGGRNKG
jgi:hypothetical protein